MKTIKKFAVGLLTAAMLVTCFVFPASAASHPFTDVPGSAWYAGNVQYVYDNGLMAGTAADKFSPNIKMSRAMLVTVLYRMDGAGAVTGSIPFTDVKSTAYYYAPMLWAYQKGIITGTAADKASPNMDVTREMMVTIFHRYAMYREMEVSQGANLGQYTDAGKVAAYAKEPFQWAVQAGVIKGMTATTLNPKGTATRAECAAVLQRFCGLEGGAPVLPEEWPLLPGDPVSLMGYDTESFLLGGNLYVRVEDFAKAFNINLVLTDGRLFLDGQSLSVAVLCREEGNFVPVLALAQCLNCGVFVDTEMDGRTYIYTASSTDIPEGIFVPVLMYHSVSDDIWGVQELFVSPSEMEAQLKYLVDNGYDPIFFSDLDHVDQYDKPVILTFDDGYDDNYLKLYPLLQKYQIKATMFIITDYIGRSHKMTQEQILEMSRSGLVSIQSHTATHPHLADLSEEQMIQEMKRSQQAVTRITGIKPDVLCYPYGNFNTLTRTVAARYYNYALMMGPGGYVTGRDTYIVGRYYVARATTLSQFADMVSGAGKKS